MNIKKILNLQFKNCLFIIHNDLDGRGCEVVVKTFMGNNYSGISFEVIEADDGDISLKEAIYSGLYDLIIMSDCSFRNKGTLGCVENYISEGNQFFLVDHHKNAMEYENYDWSFVSIEENGVKNSGTELLYKFLIQQLEKSYTNEDYNLILNPVLKNDKLKEFVELVRKYDTWDWFKENNLNSSNLATLCAFDGNGFVKDMVNSITNNSPIFDNKQQMILEIINKSDKAYIERCMKNVKTVKMGKNKTIAVIAANQLQGAIANETFKVYQNISYIIFIVSATKLSLRSRDDKEDVFVIANAFNGGGHRNAAGLSLPNKMLKIIKFVFKSYLKVRIFKMKFKSKNK